MRELVDGGLRGNPYEGTHEHVGGEVRTAHNLHGCDPGSGGVRGTLDLRVGTSRGTGDPWREQA